MAQQVNMPRQQRGSLEDLADLTRIGSSIYSIFSDVKKRELDERKQASAEQEALRIKNAQYYPGEALEKAYKSGIVPITAQEAASRDPKEVIQYGTDYISKEPLLGVAKSGQNDLAERRFLLALEAYNAGQRRYGEEKQTKAQDKFEGKVEKLSDRIGKQSVLTSVYTNMQELDRLLGQIPQGGDIPGVGSVEGGLPSPLLNLTRYFQGDAELAKNIRATFDRASELLNRKDAGANLTAPEIASMKRSIKRLGFAKNEDDFLSAVGQIKRELYSAIKRAEGGFDSSIVQEYYNRVGEDVPTSMSSLFGRSPLGRTVQTKQQTPGAPQFGGGSTPAQNRPSVTIKGQTVYVGDTFTGGDGKRYQLLDDKGNAKEVK